MQKGEGHVTFHTAMSTDVPLEAEAQTASAHEVLIDNFSFTPGTAIHPKMTGRIMVGG